jgi:hypothetical protein
LHTRPGSAGADGGAEAVADAGALAVARDDADVGESAGDDVVAPAHAMSTGTGRARSSERRLMR